MGPGAEPHPDLGEFSKISKNLSGKLRKWIYLSIFFKIFKNHEFRFLEFGQKIQCFGQFREYFKNFNYKFNWKIEFLTIFGKVLRKIGPAEITSFSYKKISILADKGSLCSVPSPPPLGDAYEMGKLALPNFYSVEVDIRRKLTFEMD